MSDEERAANLMLRLLFLYGKVETLRITLDAASRMQHPEAFLTKIFWMLQETEHEIRRFYTEVLQ